MHALGAWGDLPNLHQCSHTRETEVIGALALALTTWHSGGRYRLSASSAMGDTRGDFEFVARGRFNGMKASLDEGVTLGCMRPVVCALVEGLMNQAWVYMPLAQSLEESQWYTTLFSAQGLRAWLPWGSHRGGGRSW